MFRPISSIIDFLGSDDHEGSDYHVCTTLASDPPTLGDGLTGLPYVPGAGQTPEGRPSACQPSPCTARQAEGEVCWRLAGVLDS